MKQTGPHKSLKLTQQAPRQMSRRQEMFWGALALVLAVDWLFQAYRQHASHAALWLVGLNVVLALILLAASLRVLLSPNTRSYELKNNKGNKADG